MKHPRFASPRASAARAPPESHTATALMSSGIGFVAQPVAAVAMEKAPELAAIASPALGIAYEAPVLPVLQSPVAGGDADQQLVGEETVLPQPPQIPVDGAPGADEPAVQEAAVTVVSPRE